MRWLGVIADLPGVHPTVIASNGAVLYDLASRRTLDRLCLDPEVALDAVASIRASVPDAAFAFESGTHFGYEPAYRTWVPDTGQDPTLRRAPVEQLAREVSAVKMLVQSAVLGDDALLARVQACVGGRAHRDLLHRARLRAGRAQRRRGRQGEHAGADVRTSRRTGPSRCRLRRHAE